MDIILAVKITKNPQLMKTLRDETGHYFCTYLQHDLLDTRNESVVSQEHTKGWSCTGLGFFSFSKHVQQLTLARFLHSTKFWIEQDVDGRGRPLPLGGQKWILKYWCRYMKHLKLILWFLATWWACWLS